MSNEYEADAQLSRSDFIAKNVSSELVFKVKPHLVDIEKIFAWEEDFPHRRAHIIQTQADLFHIQWDFGELGPLGFYRASRILELHDKGYVLVKRGIIQPEEHHFASVMIAEKVEPDVGVLWGILHHIDDTLPQGTPLFIRVARDIDRSAIGYPGMVRLAFYLGFEDTPLTLENEEKFIEEGILCDHGFPENEDYEGNAKRFFDSKVLPYLLSEDTRRGDFVLMAHKLIRRFMGNTRRGIEPVMREVQHFFEAKLRNTILAMESVREGMPLSKSEIKDHDIFNQL